VWIYGELSEEKSIVRAVEATRREQEGIEGFVVGLTLFEYHQVAGKNDGETVQYGYLQLYRCQMGGVLLYVGMGS